MPTAQLVQATAPDVAAYVPAPQLLHAWAPAADAYWPLAHGTQAGVPTSGALVPAGQLAQLESPGPLEAPTAQPTQLVEVLAPAPTR